MGLLSAGHTGSVGAHGRRRRSTGTGGPGRTAPELQWFMGGGSWFQGTWERYPGGDSLDLVSCSP